MPLSVAEFVERRKAIVLTEPSAAQSHFIDLCELLRQKHPAAADHIVDTFTFEEHVFKAYGGKGFADVWKRGFFACEYKAKHRDRVAHGLPGLSGESSFGWWSATWTFSE